MNLMIVFFFFFLCVLSGVRWLLCWLLYFAANLGVGSEQVNGAEKKEKIN